MTIEVMGNIVTKVPLTEEGKLIEAVDVSGIALENPTLSGIEVRYWFSLQPK